MKILIVDDSRLARKELAGLLEQHPQCEIVGEASDVQSAVAAVNQLQPDLVLLDINLPDGTGFDVLERSELTPGVIFTTAYEEHALHAFQVNALDYLLKPITRDRLDEALLKMEQRAKHVPFVQPEKSLDAHIFIREGERCHFIKFREISRIAVEGNYVRLHFGTLSAPVLRSLNYVEARLDPQTFFRANRQEIINLNFIDRIEPWIGDGLMIVMQDCTEVIASRRQARELKQRLEF